MSITLTSNYEVVDPGCCKVPFAMNLSQYRRARDTHSTWYCPNCGKPRRFSGESDLERAKRLAQDAEARLAAERARHDQTRAARDAANRRLIATKGVVTRTKNRISKGVCPCCNRHFANLHRHMSNQHPDYATAES